MKERGRLVYSTEQNVPRKEKEQKTVSAAGADPGGLQVRVRLDKKGRGGKTVSVVTGLNLQPDEMEKLLKRFKTRLGTGGTIKDGNLEIQGDHCAALITLLAEIGCRSKRAGG